MDKKILSFIAISGLFVFFTVICILLFFSKAPSPALVRRKMKTGALILSLTAFISTHSFSQKTCYKVAMDPINVVSFTNEFVSPDGGIKVDLSKEERLYGYITEREDSAYTYKIKDSKDSLISKGSVMPADGFFNTEKEKFSINLFDVQAGKYKLYIYPARNEEYTENVFDMEVKNQPKVINTCYY